MLNTQCLPSTLVQRPDDSSLTLDGGTAAAGQRASSERCLHPLLARAYTAPARADGVAGRASSSGVGFAASPLRGELVRDYIHDSLYHPTEGYFTSRPVSVGELPERLDFHRFQGSARLCSPTPAPRQAREVSLEEDRSHLECKGADRIIAVWLSRPAGVREAPGRLVRGAGRVVAHAS
jgi:hypothetical protein